MSRDPQRPGTHYVGDACPGGHTEATGQMPVDGGPGKRSRGPHPAVERCTGCGSWVWRVNDLGCPTCAQQAAGW